MFRGRYERGNLVDLRQPSGGARRDRTDDLMLAKHALSQLSYGPVPEDEWLMPVETHLFQERTALDQGGGPGKT